MSRRRQYDVYATSLRLRIDVETTLLSNGMELYKTINSVKTVFQEIWAMVQSGYHVEQGFGEHSFRILHFIYNAYRIKDYFSLIPRMFFRINRTIS